MQVDFFSNTDYELVGEFDGNKIYALVDPNKYHLSRFVEAQNQNIMASCGMTKDKLLQVANEMIKLCNEQDYKQLRTDIGALANYMKYCTQYPIENECALKVGCIFTFIDGEDPNVINRHFEQTKLNLARNNADAYAFFLSMGMRNIPEYSQILNTSEAMDYSKRQEMLMSLLPDSLRHISA